MDVNPNVDFLIYLEDNDMWSENVEIRNSKPECESLIFSIKSGLMVEQIIISEDWSCEMFSSVDHYLAWCGRLGFCGGNVSITAKHKACLTSVILLQF